MQKKTRHLLHARPSNFAPKDQIDDRTKPIFNHYENMKTKDKIKNLKSKMRQTK